MIYRLKNLSPFVALTLMLAGCSADISRIQSRPVVFEPRIEKETKATLKTGFENKDAFRVWAYNKSGILANGYEPEGGKVTYNGSTWNCNVPLLWTELEPMTFVAYYPYNLSVMTISPQMNKVSCTGFTLNQGVDALAGYYSGLGYDGVAPIRFYHMLSGLKFFIKEAAQECISEITSISVTVPGTGDFVADFKNGDPDIIWNSVAAPTNFSQALSSQSLAKDAVIGTPFLAIPQTNAGFTLSLNVKFSNNTTRTLSQTVSGAAFNVGRISVYAVTLPKSVDISTLTVESWTDDEPIDEPIENQK